MAAEKIGRITQVIGAVLDIRFQAGELPLINEAIRIKREDGGELVAEVSQHLGDDTVRCIAMGSTDGLRRGMEAIATGAAISVPVGAQYDKIQSHFCARFLCMPGLCQVRADTNLVYSFVTRKRFEGSQRKNVSPA